jgi:hypothetical protein
MLFVPEMRKEIFEKIKFVLQKQSPPMLVSKNSENCFELTGNKPVAYGSKKQIVQGMYFSSVVAHKDMISFHFFPIYMKKELFEPLIPTTKKYMKGKSCFNFKKAEQVNETELTALLKKGAEAWKKLGYMQ